MQTEQGEGSPPKPLWGWPEKTLTTRIADWIARLPCASAIAIASAFVLVVTVLDFVTEYRFGISRFYWIAVLFITWAQGRRTGLAMSVIVTILWITAEWMHHPLYRTSLIPYLNHVFRFGFFVVSVYILSALRDSLMEETYAARTDFLTGIPNRRHFFELARTEIRRSSRYRHPFIVAYLDIDDFKRINDRFGHGAGDAILQSVAQNIRRSLREVDVVARLGGDEFAILLPETGPKSAQEVMRKVKANLNQVIRQINCPVTFSIGTVTYTDPPESVEEMIRKADVLMYQVKSNGKNTVKHEVSGSAVPRAN